MTDPAKLSPQQKGNLAALIQEAVREGVTNKFSHTGIASVVGKESDFKYQFEGSYKNTSNARIREIFSDRVAKYNDAQLTKLKKNDIEFFDVVYGYKSALGRKYGNTKPGDGYKYRGGGPNQVTFKSAYERLGKQIGVDLVNHPELINTGPVAAKIAVRYFINAFKAAPKATLAKYNSTGINDFKTVQDSVNAFYHANAGFGKSTAAIEADKTGGLKKARDASDDFYKFLSENKVAVGGGGIFFLGAAGVLITRIMKNKKTEETK